MVCRRHADGPPIDPGNGPSDSPDTVTVLGNFKSILATLSQNMGNTGSQVKVYTTEGIEIGDLCVISDGTFSEIFLATDLTDTPYLARYIPALERRWETRPQI